jgi:hypothetical protein
MIMWPFDPENYRTARPRTRPTSGKAQRLKDMIQLPEERGLTHSDFRVLPCQKVFH